MRVFYCSAPEIAGRERERTGLKCREEIKPERRAKVRDREKAPEKAEAGVVVVE
jgi:hypothetical protein